MFQEQILKTSLSWYILENIILVTLTRSTFEENLRILNIWFTWENLTKTAAVDPVSSGWAPLSILGDCSLCHTWILRISESEEWSRGNHWINWILILFLGMNRIKLAQNFCVRSMKSDAESQGGPDMKDVSSLPSSLKTHELSIFINFQIKITDLWASWIILERVLYLSLSCETSQETKIKFLKF